MEGTVRVSGRVTVRISVRYVFRVRIRKLLLIDQG